MRDTKITVKDIARISGYSTATISRAVNDRPGVSAKVRKKVLDLCGEVGYYPNNSARALRRKKTYTIGAVIPTLDNAAYARMIEAIQKELSQNSFTLIHTQSNYDIRIEYEQSRLLIERGAEGLILVGALHSDRLQAIVNQSKIPCVNTYSYYEASDIPCVGFDNCLAMYDVVDFLIQMGHQKIAYISGVMKDNDRVSERMRGVVKRLAESGYVLPEHLIQQARYTISDGYNAMKKLLKFKDAFTAVICGSDILAFGALSACRDFDVKVPADVSIMGFDNQHFAQHLWPPLTTIDTPGDLMGEISARMIIEAVNNNQKMESVLLKTSIVHRKTVGSPR